MKSFPRFSCRRLGVFVFGATALLCGIQHAQAQDVTPSSFAISATPNPITSGTASTTFAASLTGISGAPSGNVSFFIDPSSLCDSASQVQTTLGTVGLGDDGTASLNFPYTYLIPTGSNYLCASYTGDSFYAPETTSSTETTAPSIVFTEYSAYLNVSAPAVIQQNQVVNIVVTATSIPAGYAAPTGTVSLYDQFSNQTYGPYNLTPGTGGSTVTIPLTGLAPGAHEYTITYNGDTNYSTTGYSGSVFVQGGLIAVSPAAIPAGSSDTTITITGLGFTNGSIAQLIPSNGNPVSLATTYVSATKLQAVVPKADLATAQPYALLVATTGANTDAVTLNIYTQLTDQIALTATPATTTFTSGQTASLTLTTGVTRGAATDAAVPSGSVDYSIIGTATGSSSQALGTPSFLTQSPTTTGSYLVGTAPNITNQPQKLLAADFNNDGFADTILLGAYDSNYLQLLLSAGPDLFQSDYEIYTGCAVADFAVIDLNKDGNQDIVVACGNPSTAVYGVYLLGNGDGSFQAPVTFAAGNSAIMLPYYIAAGDFNGDGAVDITLLDNSGNMQVFAGSTAFGTFTPLTVTTYPVPDGPPINVVSADFNQDGKSDLAAFEYQFNYNGSTGSGAVIVLTSNGDGTFSTQQQTFTSQAEYLAGQTLAVTDLTGSGYPSVVVPDTQGFPGNGAGQLIIYQNNGAGMLNAAVDYPAANVVSVTGIPFPSIGKPAAAAQPGYTIFYSAVSGDSTDPLTLQTLSSATVNGELSLTPGPALSNFGFAPFCDCSTLYVPMVAADFNGDGYLDVMASANVLSGYNSNGTEQVIPLFYSNDAVTSETVTLPTLDPGTYNIVATYGGDVDYAGGTANYPITINPGSNLTLTSVSPASEPLGTAATPVTLTGTGFTANSIVQLNGNAIATTYTSATQLQATIPASFFASIETGTITVTDPTSAGPSNGFPISVTPPSLQVVLSGPPTAPPATQPTINFQLPTAYPLPITGTFTLTVQPPIAGGLVDPAVQFASGGDTFTFTLPANTTTTPTVQLQTGTLTGAITVALTLTADGTDITPASLQPVVVQVPASAPTITSMSLTRSGTTLTVTIQGFSNTRDMRSGNFTFTAASGATINNPNLTVDLTSAYVSWYGQAASDQYGSAFTYIQTFLLTDDASTVGSVSATLVNSIGTSNSKSAQ